MADNIKITQITAVEKSFEQEEQEVSNLANKLDLKVHNQFLETKFDGNAPLYLTASVTPITKSIMSKASDMQEVENGLFAKLDALLAEENPDFSLIMDEILKLVSVITRNSEKMDREMVQVRINALFDKVKDVQGTFDTKRERTLAIACAVLLCVSGICFGVAGFNGANDIAKSFGNFAQGASSFSQIPSTFMKLDDEARQSTRQYHQATLEEVRRKLTQDQDSAQRKKSAQDKTNQNIKDSIEKWDRTFTEFTR